MNVRSSRSLRLLDTNFVPCRSRYQPSYDSNESRRSPRDQSPGRYNDSRDDFRGGSARGGERRRSPSDSRTNHNAFASNRELFRDSVGHNPSREFPSREPPRGPGPKGVPDAPTGPRASSSYGGDHRGEFGGGYRGDFRDRGRGGRGRGWRDDSRDRGRDIERDYRDRREDRAPPYRERERWNREIYRGGGRRPSSPQGRGRSPTYNSRDGRDTRDARDLRDTRDTRDTRDPRDNRDTRDPPPSLDIDRSRRGSRDGPLSGGSPSSDTTQPFYRGYGGRSRGGRGRGRGGYYDEPYHRPQGRSRSPDNNYNRRTQPSATPPPQVPAFGSSTNSIPVAPSASAVPTAPTGPSTISGPVPGVAVPTAPRATMNKSRGVGFHSKSLIIDNSKKELLEKPDTSASHATGPVLPLSAQITELKDIPSVSEMAIDKPEHKPETASSVPEPVEQQSAVAPFIEPPPKRRPIIGKRPPKPRRPSRQEIIDEASDEDSGDEGFDDSYFENEIKKLTDEIALGETENPLLPPTIPSALSAVVKPWLQYSINSTIRIFKAKDIEPCEAPEAAEEPAPELPNVASLAPILQPKGGSRPTTPLTESTPLVESVSAGNASHTNGEESIVRDDSLRPGSDRSPSVALPPTSYSTTDADEDAAEREASELAAQLMPTIKSRPRLMLASVRATPRLMMETFEDDSEGEVSAVEGAEEFTAAELAAVRKTMKTPPILSLPNFGSKKWFEDPELLKDLEPKPQVEQRIRQSLLANKNRVQLEQETEGQAWKDRYLTYRRWTDLSDDAIAVRSREKFAKSRAKTAAQASAPKSSVMASAGAREGTRRGGRFATEHDFERVLRESEKEAKESKEREQRESRATTASAKEATIPDMIWDPEERQRLTFLDESRKVPFERSLAILEFEEPIDNFTPEECEIFERVYIEHPKEWHTIAAALPRRDFKACVQHYYLVKHKTNLKEKVKGTKKSTRRRKGKNAKPNGLIAVNDDEDPDDGTRRRPRRAAAPVFNTEAAASESEVASPAPTPGRKPTATPKVTAPTDAAPKQKKTRAPREPKVPKQTKNSQLLAAAPPADRQVESPGTPSGSDWKNRRESSATPRFTPTQFDGPTTSQAFTPSFIPIERSNQPAPVSFETPTPTPHFPIQERLDSAPPLSFDTQQDRSRNSQQQTSSYWSVPEQTEFPALLRHFGTDWHAIAKHMTSKTHIMVKNYYQRQVDGKYKEYEDIAKEADDKRSRGESTGPPPPPIIIPKRRYDVTPGSVPRAGSAMDIPEDLLPAVPTPVLAQASPPQPPSLSARFPALAQAGPVPHTPSTPSSTSVLAKHLPQNIQQAPPTAQQQARPPRGPPLGFFNTDATPRPTVVQPDAVSQRSLMAAQEAQMERQSALRLEREQAMQREQQQQQQQQQQQAIQREQQQQQQQAMQREQQQQQAMQRELQQQQARREQEQALQREQQMALQRERQFTLKQETESNGLQQYEPYAPPIQPQVSNPPPARLEAPKPVTPIAVEPRRNIQPQYQPRPQAVRSLMSDGPIPGREIKSSPTPAIQRPPMSAPPASQEQYSAPPPPAPIAAIRQQETVRKTSSIMSLLNDEPSDPRPTPPKRVSDVASAPPSSRTPPPHHQLQPPRYPSHNAQSSQSSSQIPQQITSQAQPQQQHLAHTQHPYASSSQHHPPHQHSSSIGQRSYTPTSYETRGYQPPSIQTQQQSYQPPRQPMSTQPPPIRREASLGDMHGGYSRTSTTSQQSTSRLKESPYSATPPPQAVRQSATSPHDLQSSEREYYQRSHQQYLAQQQATTASPQVGPSYTGASPSTYHSQQQQPQPTHRQLAFGQAPSHLASPPSQYATQHQLHRPRHDSFDGRHHMVASTAPGPTQQGYSQAPQAQGTQLPMQYQPQSSQDRYDIPYDRERERRIQEENRYRMHLEERRMMDERRHLEDSRR